MDPKNDATLYLRMPSELRLRLIRQAAIEERPLIQMARIALAAGLTVRESIPHFRSATFKGIGGDEETE